MISCKAFSTNRSWKKMCMRFWARPSHCQDLTLKEVNKFWESYDPERIVIGGPRFFVLNETGFKVTQCNIKLVFLLSPILLMALRWSSIVFDFLTMFMILQEASILCPFVSKYFQSHNRIFCKWENPKLQTWWTCPCMFDLTSLSFYGPGNTMHGNITRMIAF